MFFQKVDLFDASRPAEICQPISELQAIANSFNEILSFINESNATDDVIEQMKYLTAGFVD